MDFMHIMISQKNLEIVNFLQKNKFKIIKNNKKLNSFMVKI